MEIFVPKLNDGPTDITAMFRLWNTVDRCTDAAIELDFSRCNFLRHTGVAFLGGLVRHAERRGIEVRIRWATIHSAIMNNLKQNGFAGTFGDFAGPWRGNSVPFREDKKENEVEIMTFLKAHWLGQKGVKVSDRLGNAIRGIVWEIYANAFEHSESAVGVFTCGQLYPKREQFCLSVADFGHGIPHLVNGFRGRQTPPHEALAWAFRRGNTTQRTPKKSRGMGLDLLRSFVSVNDGQLSIYSGGAYAHINKKGEKFAMVGEPFRGTIVDIRLKCDESVYILSSELSKDPFF